MKSLIKKVVVITINYRQNDYTLKCIDSLLTSNYSDFEIILIDNGPSGEDHQQLKTALPKDERIHLHYLEKNIGYVGGVNYGLAEAERLNAGYVLIMNNDTYVDKNSIRELAKTCSDYDDMAIVTGKVFEYDNIKKIQTVGFKFTNRNTLKYINIGNGETDNRGLFENVEERDLIDDQFWLFPMELYKKIGGYSGYFFWAYEQADFALRAREAGYKLVFTPKASLWHRVHGALKSSDYNAVYCYWDTQSELIFKFLHVGFFSFIIIYLGFCFRIIRVFVKSVIFYFSGKEKIFAYALAKLQGFLYFNRWILFRNNNNGENPFK
jgi:GT2 family glycosyltransferase